ncbi:MAG: 2-amino-4-hydroxy-6-hydroxymethyldihydropteridine diphosphokinase [Bacillota bacterium]
MVDCYLGLGSNMGDRERYLRKAVGLLAEHEAIKIRKVSSIYATAPVGYTAQPDFLNVVLHAATSLSPESLLAVCLSVEQQLERIREIRWGPRTIDIDILLFDDIEVHTSRLTIPHPQMTQRLFVLLPLAELAPDLRMRGGAVKTDIRKIQDQRVQVYKPW